MVKGEDVDNNKDLFGKFDRIKIFLTLYSKLKSSFSVKLGFRIRPLPRILHILILNINLLIKFKFKIQF